MNRGKKIVVFICAMVITQLAGIIGSLFTMPNIPNWYTHLAKPALTPPPWVFGPVWTTLYFIMGVASYLVWQGGTKNDKHTLALQLFTCQLGCNVLWSIAFFGEQNPALGLAVILMLLLFLLATIYSFYRISRVAAYLLFPYLGWLLFATYLNYGIWRLN